MNRPVENCQKYTAEQVDLRNLIHADLQFEHRGETDLKFAELQSLVVRGWMQEGDENNEFDVTDAGRDVIAATLRQQAERGDGAVSDEVVAEAMLAWSGYYCDCNDANVAGNNTDALRAAIEAVAPFLHAPAEQDTSIPDWVCEQHPWMPWPHDDCAGPGMLPRSFGELSVAVQAALAQNAQGEAAAWLASDGTGRVIEAKAKDAGSRTSATKAAVAVYSIPLYTHAELKNVQVEAVTDQQMRNLVYKLRDAPTYPEYAIQAADVIEKLHAERAMVPDSMKPVPDDSDDENTDGYFCLKCGHIPTNRELRIKTCLTCDATTSQPDSGEVKS